jgi:hypothetical protein
MLRGISGLAFVATVILVACGGDNPGAQVSCDFIREHQPRQQFAENIAFEAGRDEFRAGEPIEISFLITNCTDERVTRRYRDSQRYEVTVSSVSSTPQVIWRSSDEKTFTQEAGEETLEPGETRLAKEVWDQRSGQGVQVDPGMYNVSAQDLACLDVTQACASGVGVVIRIGD